MSDISFDVFVTSHGMLLAAVIEGKKDLVLLAPDGDIPNGTKIS